MGKSDSQNRFEDYLEEQLKDPALKAEYDAFDPEFEEIRGKIEREKALKAAIEKGTMPETGYPEGYVGELREEATEAKKKVESGEKPVFDSIGSLLDELENKKR